MPPATSTGRKFELLNSYSLLHLHVKQGRAEYIPEARRESSEIWHPARRPERVYHSGKAEEIREGAVSLPMLFLSGTRDVQADMGLLQQVCKKLGKRVTLHSLDTADHGFRVLKRSRKSEEDVFVEMARAVREWGTGFFIG
jgi:hypothetical protein